MTDRKDGLWSYYALCPVEDDLAREHLDVLRSTLARRPDADALLAKLHEWLRAKNRGTACAADTACASAKKRRAPRATRARWAGGSR